MAEMQPNILNS